MKVIREIVCSKCGKKQTKNMGELLQADLFWRVCEFCHQYGLTLVTKHKLTVREWMLAFFNTLGFRVVQIETFLKDISKDRSRH
jgi:hypothetical protein